MLPVIVATAELADERRSSAEPFGARGDAWATCIGVTLGNSSNRVFGRGWWRGLGNWSMPAFWWHPVPLGLCIEVRVRSPRYVETDSRFMREGRPIGIIQSAWELDAAARAFHAAFDSPSGLDWEGLVAYLETMANVYDEDDE